MISAAVFPSYFLKDEASVVATQAALDAAIFLKIASALGIKRRYLGEEPFSATTNQYNAMLRATLPAGGVECVIVPRLAEDGLAISASRVRILLQDGQLEHVRKLVPETTFEYLMRNIEQ
jgi:[citrate (pro-3S)-lyase] ligase